MVNSYDKETFHMLRQTVLIATIALVATACAGGESIEDVTSPPTDVTIERPVTTDITAQPGDDEDANAATAEVESQAAESASPPGERDDSSEVPSSTTEVDAESTEEPDSSEREGEEEPVPSVSDQPKWVVAEVWRYGIADEALDLVDPESVGADKWKLVSETENYGQKRYYTLYWFNDPEGDTDQEVKRFDAALRIARLSKFEQGNTIYSPVRYDLHWEDYPGVVSLTAYFPLGENRRVEVSANGESWTVGDSVFILSNSTDAGTDQVMPKGPPIRLTTPFAEPRWPDTAEALGRDCLPVEVLWSGNGSLVRDQCTLDAVDTALRFAWREPSELRQRAIRDGHVLTDLFHRLDNQYETSPFLAALTGEEARAQLTVEVANIKWAGTWPGASMIHLEFRIVHPDREMTEDERQSAIRYYAAEIAQGKDVKPKNARGDLTLGFAWRWESALMVRTADGTWRMSYRSFCRWYQVFGTGDQPKYLCSDDPTPHFPDSDLYDEDLYPPSHPRYYTDSRQNVPETPIHDGGTPRDNTEYVGVPPS